MAKVTEQQQQHESGTTNHSPPPEPPGAATAPKKIISKALPPPPDKNLPIEAALKYWAETDALHPGRLLAYLYRLWPIIKKGGTTNIWIYAEPVNYKTLLNQWGAGKYKLHVNDKDKSKWGELTISRWETKEDYAECPPVLDDKDLDWGHKDNQSYVQWLKSRGNPMGPQASQTSDAAVQGLVSTLNVLLAEIKRPKEPGGDVAAFSRIADMMSAGHKASLEMALSQVKQNSPEDTIKLLTMMQAAFSPKDTGGAKASDAMTTYLLQELKSSRDQQTALVNRLLDQKTGAAKEDSRSAALMDRMMDLAFERLSEGGGTAKPPGKWAWLETFKPEISELVTSIGMFARRAPAFPRPAANPQQPAAQPPAAGLPAPVEQPAAQQAATPSTEEATMQELGQFLMQVWTPLVKFIKEGRNAIDFADYLVEGFGFTVTDHDRIKEFGRDKMLAMVEQQGAAALKLQGISMERFTKFLDQFLTWEPAAATDDGGPAEDSKAKVM